ncbi:MAG: FAD-dependent oxidoreductase, partial [Proteobacteria bacterium]|nr:FAD-dependent oxidoreductase [Pseudomonadota bacterium]
ACRGCGVCVGACPRGAIRHPGAERGIPARRGGLLVIACARSGLFVRGGERVPEGATAMELPCAGGAGPAMILGAIARGFDGVLVLGRQQETCRLNGAEDRVRGLAPGLDALVARLGLGEGRIRFVDPERGREGPIRAIEAVRAEIPPTPLKETYPADRPTDSIDDARAVIDWLAAQRGVALDAAERDLLLDAQDAYSAGAAGPAPRKEPDAAMGGRITSHPILAAPPDEAAVELTFNGRKIAARPGEMIASALFAAGISVFGHHRRDRGPQGIFCANGQCSQCTVLADGRAVKSCMTRIRPGMRVESVEGTPPLAPDDAPGEARRPEDVRTRVLVLGGGPAGLCAAIELGRAGIDVLIVDDKPELGGKLTLQTHQFFGSVADCWAGTRGIDIGHLLADDVAALPNVRAWTESTAIGVFWDGKVGVATPGGYRLVTPENILVATGAREKALSFPGCDLPGVYGAGAFQTLVNRDRIRASQRLFILGGGNVGLIGGYHALQAGIDVVGLVEALPECGGYKVHADKLRRLGVPIWTSHTVIKAAGRETLERVTIARIDERFRAIPGTERTFEADTLLIAVGLAPVDELLAKARGYGIKVWAAGDAEEVAEASAAIFSGRIAGRRMARALGAEVEIPEHWERLAAILRSRPGKTSTLAPPEVAERVYPVLRCVQEIPCDPCVASCPQNLISMDGVMGLPRYERGCLGCGTCVAVCPGLAINLVCEDYDPAREFALVVLPFEFGDDRASLGDEVATVGMDGEPVGAGRIVAVRERKDQDRRRLLFVEVPFAERLGVAGFRIRGPSIPTATDLPTDAEDPIVCRCERVRRSDIVREIRAGVRDVNQLKALVRPTMGGCGGKTCAELVARLYREEGLSPAEITPGTIRPLIAEVPLGSFAAGPGGREGGDD